MNWVVFMTAVLLLGGDGGIAEPPFVTTLRECDAVVRGEVISVVRGHERTIDAMPMLEDSGEDNFVTIARVNLRVDEALWGEVAQGPLAFVVFTALSGFRDDYEPGQHLVVGLKWNDAVLGGSYWLFSERGRLTLGPSGWIVQRDQPVINDLSVLVAAFRSSTPREVVSRADLVVIGSVETIAFADTISPAGRYTRYMIARLEGVMPVAGDVADEVIEVVQITAGECWPDWCDPVPFRDLKDGSRYCFVLRKIDRGYTIVRGINGVWEIRDRHLYFAGRARVPLTVDDIRREWESSR